MIDRLLQTLVGKPLQRHQADSATLPNFEALAILSSDALSSVAYGTEAALGVLVLAGSGALKLSIPITLAIIALVAIVVLSYRQTIEAYPQGGGSYVVARENLGTTASLVAAASLLIDYVLTAAVSLMAGTQALSSLLPQLLPHEVSFSLILLVLVGWANLRGVKDAGRLFAYPTYAFVVMVALMALAGVVNLAFGHGFHADPPPPIKALEPLGLFLILRAFSSGCSAMTGIEAISNGVKLFRAPAAANARLTMVVMGVRDSTSKSMSILRRLRLSTTTTSWPPSARFTAQGQPQKPSPPSTKTFTNVSCRLEPGSINASYYRDPGGTCNTPKFRLINCPPSLFLGSWRWLGCALASHQLAVLLGLLSWLKPWLEPCERG